MVNLLQSPESNRKDEISNPPVHQLISSAAETCSQNIAQKYGSIPLAVILYLQLVVLNVLNHNRSSSKDLNPSKSIETNGETFGNPPTHQLYFISQLYPPL